MRTVLIERKPRNPLNKMKYCKGKYAWTGKASDYYGKPVKVSSDDVKRIWVERRTDKNGPYAVLMCSY